MTSRIRFCKILVLGGAIVASTFVPQGQEVRLKRVFRLGEGETVYAYARISPDGRLLAYTSERGRHLRDGMTRTIRIMELLSQQELYAGGGWDGYWAPDGQSLLFVENHDGLEGVAMLDMRSGRVTHDVAPREWGDYPSWARTAGRDIIVTIEGSYYQLAGNKVRGPVHAMLPCEGLGTGTRPLVSKDGGKVTVFAGGYLAVRNLRDCRNIIYTGLRGGKADFSWDGRFIAFHAPKDDLSGYEIKVVDLFRRTVRSLRLEGSSFFPSWTRDGKLCFRYDSDGYHGFILASDVLSLAETPLPAPTKGRARHNEVLRSLVPGIMYKRRFQLVVVWSTWNAHSVDALTSAQRAYREFQRHQYDIEVVNATEMASGDWDARQMLLANGITIPRLFLQRSTMVATGAVNHIPAFLLFRDGRLYDERLGGQSYQDLLEWVTPVVTRASKDAPLRE